MMFRQCAVVLLLACIAAAADVECPQKSNLQDFSAAKYMGAWYEAYYFGPTGYDDDKCPKEFFTQEQDNITVVDSAEKVSVPGEEVAWPGYVTLADPGQLVLHQDFGDGNLISYTLNILGTDYENWAVVWACPGFNNRENSWVMTRKRLYDEDSLPEEQEKEIKKVLKKENIDWSRYQKTPNYNCTYD